MKIQYITTDLEFESTVDLNPIVKELDDILLPHLNRWVDGKYRVVFAGPGNYDEPEGTINEICCVIEKLSEESKDLWNDCLRRVADIAFESGTKPNHLTYNISESLICSLERLRISIAITIYPVGTYTYEKENKET